MNPSSASSHPKKLNLWTLGYRRYYSPMVHARNVAPSAAIPVMPRVRPSLVLRSVPTSKEAGADAHPVPGDQRRHSTL
jgi:hypothetical protein